MMLKKYLIYALIIGLMYSSTMGNVAHLIVLKFIHVQNKFIETL